MRYLFLCPSPAFGGLEMQMVRRAAEAMLHGDESVLVVEKGSRMADYADQLGVRVQYLSVRIPYADPIAVTALARILSKEEPDCCIVGITRHLSIAIAAKKLAHASAPVVLFQQMISGLRKIDFFHNWVYRNLDIAIVPTEMMADMLANSTIFPHKRIHVIPYAVDLGEFDPSKYDRDLECARFGLPNDRLIIAHLARFERLKDQETTIRAFAEANLDNAMLLLAGEGSEEYREQMKMLVYELGIQEKVRFQPFTLEFGALLSCTDIFVLSSLCETFSLALIQAMASGTAVIGTRSGGTPEAIRHDQNGLLFEPRDHATLASYMQRLAAEPRLRERLANQAREDATLLYDRAHVNVRFFQTCLGAQHTTGQTPTKKSSKAIAAMR